MKRHLAVLRIWGVETSLNICYPKGRPDIFCFTMLGMLDSVKQMLTFQPELINAKGPHGFSIHFHAQVGQENATEVLDYLQSIKKVELRPVPFLKKRKKESK